MSCDRADSEALAIGRLIRIVGDLRPAVGGSVLLASHVTLPATH